MEIEGSRAYTMLITLERILKYTIRTLLILIIVLAEIPIAIYIIAASLLGIHITYDFIISTLQSVDIDIMEIEEEGCSEYIDGSDFKLSDE